jgi:hypothetical protein
MLLRSMDIGTIRSLENPHICRRSLRRKCFYVLELGNFSQSYTSSSSGKRRNVDIVTYVA